MPDYTELFMNKSIWYNMKVINSQTSLSLLWCYVIFLKGYIDIDLNYEKGKSEWNIKNKKVVDYVL